MQSLTVYEMLKKLVHNALRFYLDHENTPDLQYITIHTQRTHNYFLGNYREIKPFSVFYMHFCYFWLFAVTSFS